jgi:integrase
MPFTTTLSVLEFIVLCGLCTAEVAGFRWRELDVEDDCWRIPAERMKSRKEHYVPSSAPAFALLPALDSGRTAYELVLPSGTGAVIWDGTFSHQLCKTGCAREQVCTHGFRS